MDRDIADLNRQFDIPGVAQVVAGNGGLLAVRVTSPAVQGEIYLHGAHVTSWKPAGAEEVLFLSTQSRFENGRAIRGGIPICFPWFGGKPDDPKAPAHGFARTKAWQLDSIDKIGEAVAISMSTESNEDTKRWWPADFRLVHRVTFGPELRLELLLKNTGETSLRFEEALHTYHRVGNIETARVHGLEGCEYVDKTDSNRKKQQQGEIMIISETDRIYLNTTKAVDLEDPSMGRRVRLRKENSRATVVWNPWKEKALGFSDFAPDEWQQMICLETCNVADYAVEVAPQEQHTMKAVLSLA